MTKNEVFNYLIEEYKNRKMDSIEDLDSLIDLANKFAFQLKIDDEKFFNELMNKFHEKKIFSEK